jgi:hypothetical protein
MGRTGLPAAPGSRHRGSVGDHPRYADRAGDPPGPSDSPSWETHEGARRPARYGGTSAQRAATPYAPFLVSVPHVGDNPIAIGSNRHPPFYTASQPPSDDMGDDWRRTPDAVARPRSARRAPPACPRHRSHGSPPRRTQRRSGPACFLWLRRRMSGPGAPTPARRPAPAAGPSSSPAEGPTTARSTDAGRRPGRVGLRLAESASGGGAGCRSLGYADRFDLPAPLAGLPRLRGARRDRQPAAARSGPLGGLRPRGPLGRGGDPGRHAPAPPGPPWHVVPAGRRPDDVRGRRRGLQHLRLRPAPGAVPVPGRRAVPGLLPIAGGRPAGDDPQPHRRPRPRRADRRADHHYRAGAAVLDVPDAADRH